jgi:hypothetical protein
MGFFDDLFEDIGGGIGDFFSDAADGVGGFFGDLGNQIEAEASRFGDKMGWNQSKSNRGGGGGPSEPPAAGLRDLGYGIDPRTGLQYGPSAMVGADFAPELQAQADRANLLLRQQHLADATRMQMGALGLLQSYRPGGGAALEAGVYDRAAESLRQEAAGFTPPDLMFPYREAKASEARSDAKKQATRELVTNAVLGVAGAASSFFGGGGGMGAQLEEEPGTSQRPTPGQPAPGQPAGAPGALPARLQGSQGQQAQGQQAQGQQFAAAQAGVGSFPPAAGSDGNFGVGAFATASAQTYTGGPQQMAMGALMNNMVSQMVSADPFYPAFGVAVNGLLASY